MNFGHIGYRVGIEVLGVVGVVAGKAKVALAHTQTAVETAQFVGQQARATSTFCAQLASSVIPQGGAVDLCKGAVKLVGTGTKTLGAYVGFFRDLGRGKF